MLQLALLSGFIWLTPCECSTFREVCSWPQPRWILLSKLPSLQLLWVFRFFRCLWGKSICYRCSLGWWLFSFTPIMGQENLREHPLMGFPLLLILLLQCSAKRLEILNTFFPILFLQGEVIKTQCWPQTRSHSVQDSDVPIEVPSFRKCWDLVKGLFPPFLYSIW